MRTRKDKCNDCNTVAEMAQIGLIPLKTIEPDINKDEDTLWVNAQVCLECGACNIINIDRYQVRQADKRYLLTLVRADILGKEEAQDIFDGSA